ncbi:MAG: HNH endonuclease [Campylobacterota bacterium]|nr:HNH endonuclease [Campylobacterota bacterium]
MSEFQKIKINDIEYFIIDSIQDFRAEDSFIHNKNKLAQYGGHGESKKHIGSYKGEIGETMSHFFNYKTWGLEHSDSNKNGWKTIHSARKSGAVIQDKNCFFSKTNLLKYLQDAKTEYLTQEQHYHDDISQYFDKRLEKVSKLPSEKIQFSIYDASDNLSQKQTRGYIRSDDKIWSLWRELILPSISYLSILKIIPSNEGINSDNPSFYFRILLDYQFRSTMHPKLSQQTQEKISVQEKVIPKKGKSRDGAQKYRRKVIDHMPQCPFTKISDERLLIASHIKPYAACINDNNQEEANDYLNGLALSPTYDKLFDQGYITFTDNGELICGTQLTPYTWEKLSINPNAKNKMRIYPEDRENYLNYHRNNVFQDDINDLLL